MTTAIIFICIHSSEKTEKPRLCINKTPKNHESNIAIIVNYLSVQMVCNGCGTRIRYGDYECPHCGRDLEDEMLNWAFGLIK